MRLFAFESRAKFRTGFHRADSLGGKRRDPCIDDLGQERMSLVGFTKDGTGVNMDPGEDNLSDPPAILRRRSMDLDACAFASTRKSVMPSLSRCAPDVRALTISLSALSPCKRRFCGLQEHSGRLRGAPRSQRRASRNGIGARSEQGSK